MTIEKAIAKSLGANSAMDQSEFLAITCTLLKVQEKLLGLQGAIGFGFASH